MNEPSGQIDSLIGHQIGPYLVERRLGEGGMSIVYKATHMQIGQPVAIKVLRHNFAGNNKILQRFFNETRGTNHRRKNH